MRYTSVRWLIVYGYVLILLVATPYLPLLIQWVSSRWSGGSVNRFVLGVEVSMGIFLLVLAGGIFYYNRRKFLRFVLISFGSIAALSLFYLVIPNPYELTHLPEYGILSILTMQALKGGEGSSRKKVNVIDARPYISPETGRGASTLNCLYFGSAVLTMAFGATDDLYQGLLPTRCFIWYDILLNGLGGVLGLAILWGISKELPLTTYCLLVN